ncbi:MAG: hypothetical protein E6Q97_00705 [Desulfurellales bacterium]|nr:MAG: hypothetical protein E6Q97_00705 [Desulfurellales bacterium]
MLNFDSEFHFCPEAHRYTMGGIELPSVTTICAPLYDWKYVDKDLLERKAALGTAVHLACQLWDEGDLDEDDLDPVIVPYLAGWKRFVADVGFAVIINEQPMYHPLLGYAGTPDRFGLVHGDPVPTLIDIKTTSVISKAVGVQTCGYTEMIKHHPLGKGARKVRRAAVRLPGDGTYRYHQFDDITADHACFIGLLNLHKWRIHNGKP